MGKTLSGAGGAGISRAASGASAPPQPKMANLYANSDTGGSITQPQFDQAYQIEQDLAITRALLEIFSSKKYPQKNSTAFYFYFEILLAH